MAMALAAPILMGVSTSAPSLGERLLSAQNRERTAVGIEPLHWDQSLAADAQSWADHLAATGQFQHAAGYIRSGAGENLWAGTRGAYSADEMVDAWTREKKDFKPGPITADAAALHAVGHYTQIVWRNSHQVGCGLARGQSLDYLVCRYRNAGNVIGQAPY